MPGLSGLHLLSAGVTGMCHHAQLNLDRSKEPETHDLTPQVLILLNAGRNNPLLGLETPGKVAVWSHLDSMLFFNFREYRAGRKSHRSFWSFDFRILAGRGKTTSLRLYMKSHILPVDEFHFWGPLLSETPWSPGTIHLTKGETEAQRQACIQPCTLQSPMTQTCHSPAPTSLHFPVSAPVHRQPRSKG